MNKLHRNDPAFISFLTWLVDTHGYQVKDIIYVVEKPWKYEDEFKEFILATDDDRSPITLATHK